VLAAGVLATHRLRAQAQSPAPVPATAQTPTVRVQTDLVSLDVIVRDAKGQFVADLKPSDFEVYEDGVKQDVASFVLVHGGRTYNQKAPPTVVAQEGVFLPQSKPTSDASGRVFLIFIDDLHLDFRSTPKTRELLGKLLKSLIHEGDMFGIATTGKSGVTQQLTYDRQILESAISRIQGEALKPQDILQSQFGSQGPIEVRHNASVAFEVAYDLMKNLERVQNRRKAVIYLSSGYDFNPFVKSRFDQSAEKLAGTNQPGDALDAAKQQLTFDPFEITQESQYALNEADLVNEEVTLINAAKRANAVIYPIDPRGLIAGQDVDQTIDPTDFADWVRQQQTTLREIGEGTGGFAIVNQNDFDKGLKRIDSETSDYYLVGFYSSNPDPTKRNREIKVKARDGLTVIHRSSYSLRPLSRKGTTGSTPTSTPVAAPAKTPTKAPTR
jgi:VWFA-related protein